MRIGDSSLLNRRERRWERGYDPLDPVVRELAATSSRRDDRALRWATAVAVAAHAVLFMTVFPSFREEPREVRRPARAYRLQQVRFEPPPPEARRAVPPPRPARKIPIPDPTPLDPEPLVREEVERTAAELPEVGTDPVAVAIPDGPPGPAAIVIAGEVVAPERLYAPQPEYPEQARLERVQGVVVLQTVIDVLGNVVDVEVLKGLPAGLTEAAVDAVSRWRFRPASLHGEPVAVRYLVTVSFSVQ